MKVAHVPGRTPYARKLSGGSIEIVNDRSVEGCDFPRDVTLAWLMKRRPWDLIDVVHLHHLDFEPVELLRQVLAECRRAGRRVVFTAHDVTPVFADRVTHQRRLRALAEADVQFVCLTARAEGEVRRRFGVRTVLAPDGYVAEPGSVARTESRPAGPTRLLMYGSLRRNRDVELVLHCWRFARRLRDTVLHLLLRAPSRAALAEDAAAWQTIREHAVDPRLVVDVLPFPTDAQTSAALADADCLLLPYRWASHSGQLEHALDLGALPVGSRTGFLPDQVAIHSGRVDEPVWFDWSDGAEFTYGARLLAGMERAHTMIQDGWSPMDLPRFAAHRRREHEEVLAAHDAAYAAGSPVARRRL